MQEPLKGNWYRNLRILRKAEAYLYEDAKEAESSFFQIDTIIRLDNILIKNSHLATPFSDLCNKTEKTNLSNTSFSVSMGKKVAIKS